MKANYDELFNEILKLQNVEECRIFFEDLCTIKELDSMLQRIKAAKMLLEDKTYVEVVDKTKISSATLSRVSKCVHYGDGGYELILNRKEQGK